LLVRFQRKPSLKIEELHGSVEALGHIGGLIRDVPCKTAIVAFLCQCLASDNQLLLRSACKVQF
jgi:hypothetical protein